MHDRHDDIEQMLREEYPKAELPFDAVRSRVRRSTRAPKRWTSLRLPIQVAAAILIFVVGSEYGRFTARDSAAPITSPTPIDIQHTGSQYVAQLATVLASSDTYSETQIREIRQVATAILYAAAIELQTGGDDHMALIAALLEASRDEQYLSTTRDPAS